MTWTLNTHPIWQVFGGIAWMLLSLIGLAIGAAAGSPAGLVAFLGVGYGIYNIFGGVKEFRKKREYDALEIERQAIRKRLEEAATPSGSSQ